MNTLTKSFAKRALSMLLVVIMVFSLGIVGITSASAAEVELAETGANTVAGGHVYFDNSTTGWTDSKIQFIIGHNSFSRSYTMTKISNTNLYYVNLSDYTYHDWGDATYYAVIGNSSVFGDGNWGPDNLKNATHYTAAYTTAYNMDVDTKHHLVVPLSNSNGTTISISYQESVANNLNHTQVVKVYGAEYGSTSYSALSSAGTVTGTGYYLSDPNSTYSGTAYTSAGTLSYNFARASTVTFTATPADGYDFVGWSTTSSESGISGRTNPTLSYNVQEHNKTYYALFKKSEPDVSITNVTATKGTESVVGTPSTISYSYSVTGNSTEPDVKLLLNGTEYQGEYTVDKTNKVITFTPTVANMNYKFSVQVSVDGVTETSGEVTYSIRDEFTASLSVDTDTLFVGDGNFTLTVTDNSDQYSAATYTLKKADGTVVEDANTTGVFTLPADVVGETTYYVTVTLSGDFNDVTVDTNVVTLTVMAKEFSVTLDAPKSAMEDRDFTITANVMFAPEGETLTYILIGSDGSNLETTDGVFTVVSNNPADVTYTVTVTASGGASVTDTVKVTITLDLGTYPVKIFFKCSDTYGYLPNATVDGNAVELTKYTAIQSIPNASDTATYSWYCYETAADVDFGTNIVFAVKANRVYFYNASYTVSAGEGDFVQGDDGYYYYYLALENLNGGSSILSNISNLTEEQRNWTESAVNMIYDVDTDALAEVALNYSFADYGDANCDGDINIKDATYIQKSLAKMVDPSTLSTTVSDVNGDGSVTIKDATAIQKQLAGL
ncbi:MAG: dockerin type I repeat-containing protein [Clostridia bacterium]|nr:dockerin type I repeat-containing protein [Clostridia bacterium]